MRAFALAAAAAVMSLTKNVAEQVQRGIEDPQGPPVGMPHGGKRKFMSEDHYRRQDKFYGIASKGRRGASDRAAMQEYRAKETRVGKRNARDDRNLSGPIFVSKNRNRVFLAAIAEGQTRNQALKVARRAEA